MVDFSYGEGADDWAAAPDMGVVNQDPNDFMGGQVNENSDFM